MQHQTLREKILENIRDAILKGELKPGERVSEPDIAERYGISRTPIREAFRQLESEGYLTVIPRKGAVVAKHTQKDIEEFYSIKSVLEGYAANLAAVKMTPKDVDKLEAINNRLAKLSKTRDVKTFFRVHNEFHEYFIRAAGNQRLLELIHQLLQKFEYLRVASLSIPGRMEISVQEHKKILEAFRSNDGTTADLLVRKNAAYGGQVLLQNKEERSTEGGKAPGCV
ncbi:MAG: GntR family transcriptional regulator [Desulfuromonadaceae bacterium]|nr:GntR family transcriptional regulator [Desulfuromonadaceae bacterium]